MHLAGGTQADAEKMEGERFLLRLQLDFQRGSVGIISKQEPMEKLKVYRKLILIFFNVRPAHGNSMINILYKYLIMSCSFKTSCREPSIKGEQTQIQDSNGSADQAAHVQGLKLLDAHGQYQPCISTG